MRFIVSRDTERDLFRVVLEIEELDVLGVALHPMDRALLRECELSGSISDKLLGLETLTRRIEEMHAKEAMGKK